MILLVNNSVKCCLLFSYRLNKNIMNVTDIAIDAAINAILILCSVFDILVLLVTGC